MRSNLKVPFAEKDEAKKLGARWDAARKIWYVVNDGDLDGFYRWSPTPHEEALAPAPRKPAKAGQNIAGSPAREVSGKVYVGVDYLPQTRICDCLPWDVCDVCRSSALNHQAAFLPCKS